VLAPTRELATQIDAVIAPLAKAYGLTTTTIFGGVSQQRQERSLRAASTSSSPAPAASRTS
jgi:superfamily II DNA/RNA helicase